MKKEFVAGHLDIVAFTDAAGTREGHEPLQSYERLQEEAQGPSEGALVHWQATGELRPVPGTEGERWLHLGVDTVLPLTCQRCLTPVEVALEADCWFRFVADEATAEAQDDESEEDLLVLSREFDLRSLIEDELLMAMPLVPLHDVCPSPVKMAVVDPDFEEAVAAKPNPFAALAALQKKP